jgi:hypothetical protein
MENFNKPVQSLQTVYSDRRYVSQMQLRYNVKVRVICEVFLLGDVGSLGGYQGEIGFGI